MSSSAPRRFVLLVGLVLLAAAIWFYSRRQSPASTDAARTAATSAPASTPAATTNPSAASASAAGAAAARANDANTDFRSSLDSVQAFTDPFQRSQEFVRVLQRWLEHDAPTVLAYVRALPAGSLRTQAVLMTLDFMAQADADGALRVAADLVANRDERAFYNLLFSRLAQSDPAAAVQRLALVPAVSRENAVRAVADAWAQRDLPAALEWAQNLPEADRGFALESALQLLAETDPQRAIQLARPSLSGAALERLVTAALQKLTPTDPSAAATIVSQLPPGEVQTLAALDVARALAARNPADALAWVKTLPAGNPQRLALNNALTGWAEKDAPAAGAYVAQLSADPAQDFAVDHYARLLGARAPQTAIAWTQTLATESARVTAFITIGSAWAQHEPAAAVQWAATLPDGAGQAGAVTGAFSYWQQRDPAAAQAWLTNASLPAEVKARLRKSP